ncbi:hypothetical protein L249_8061 [Ophiocordyceps polyrhachis-furcata BCC 54312]|uniref:Uncharacterized protein n=1 Tax=Ophiocordyceps polyrhachis-furcata BCC 54312 TaxID=1330021 RepID=A0A367LHG9_9HYPO|nr:hypothetical protein L249_8061 [Ophiocordyceps polyrhachis-furcata BCC 54312]
MGGILLDKSENRLHVMSRYVRALYQGKFIVNRGRRGGVPGTCTQTDKTWLQRDIMSGANDGAFQSAWAAGWAAKGEGSRCSREKSGRTEERERETDRQTRQTDELV